MGVRNPPNSNMLVPGLATAILVSWGLLDLLPRGFRYNREQKQPSGYTTLSTAHMPPRAIFAPPGTRQGLKHPGDASLYIHSIHSYGPERPAASSSTGSFAGSVVTVCFMWTVMPSVRKTSSVPALLRMRETDFRTAVPSE